jgi:hypothetical protein
MHKSVIFFVLSTLSFVSNAAAPAGIDYEVNREQIIVEDHFISSEEPNVIDALWTDKHVFKVGMVSDGSNRDGYAQHVCQVLYDYDYKGDSILVRVIDYPRLLDGDGWVNLGSAQCK